MSSETYRKVADPSLAPSFVKGRGTQRAPAVPGWLYVVAVAVAAVAEAALSAGALHVEPQGRSQTWQAFCLQDSWALVIVRVKTGHRCQDHVETRSGPQSMCSRAMAWAPAHPHPLSKVREGGETPATENESSSRTRGFAFWTSNSEEDCTVSIK